MNTRGQEISSQIDWSLKRSWTHTYSFSSSHWEGNVAVQIARHNKWFFRFSFLSLEIQALKSWKNQATLEQLFQPHNRHSQCEDEWMEYYNTRKWVLKGLLIQGMKIRIKETTNRIPDDQRTKRIRSSLHCQTVIMKLWSCLIWAKEKRWKTGESNLPYCHTLKGRLCPYSEGKNLTFAWKRAWPVYTYFVSVKAD